jgi:hypothetical protein
MILALPNFSVVADSCDDTHEALSGSKINNISDNKLCTNHFSVVTPRLFSSHLSGLGGSWLLGSTMGTHSLAPLFSRFDFFGFFLTMVFKIIVYHEKVQNVSQSRDRIIITAEYVTSDVLASTGQETMSYYL